MSFSPTKAIRVLMLGISSIALSAGATLPSSFQASDIITESGFSLRHLDFIQDGGNYLISTDAKTAFAVTSIDPNFVSLFTGTGETSGLGAFGPADATAVPGMGSTWTYNCIAYAIKDRKADPAGTAGLGVPTMPKWLQPYEPAKTEIDSITVKPDGSVEVKTKTTDPVDLGSKMLSDNGWGKVAEGAAKAGDIVRYTKVAPNTNGKAVTQHFAVVTAVAGGKVTGIRSKWGATAAYDGKPEDVPASYGPVEGFYSGGKLLADPPATVSLSIFAGVPDVTLKNSLLDTLFDDVPFGSMNLVGADAGTWNYEFLLPTESLSVNPGDKVTIYADGIIPTSATVSGLAALSSFGAWQVDLLNTDADRVTFMATASAVLPESFTGFAFDSTFINVGMIPYREEVAGSLGITFGPVVPEPAASAMIVLVAMISLRRSRPHRN